jgi:hypothetical protein
MNNNINSFRQPMVTSTGILLGFMLNFASSWVPKAFSTNMFIESIIALCLLVCVPILVIVLYRILRMHVPEQNIELYYSRTLRLFIIGVSMPFATLVVIMLRSLLNIWQ